MRRLKSLYEFRQSQVFTPQKVVKLFWQLLGERRPDLKSVIDLGAGDGRLSHGGNFQRYLGIEIDENTPSAKLPPNATIHRGCAFECEENGWDAAIGNPPYVRHHYIELPWTEKIAERFKETLNVTLNRQANLYVYFFLLGLELTKEKGVVAMITPYEWVSRPSSKPLRDLINQSGWSVEVYRFKEDVFDGVMTTASISIIDKSTSSSRWSFHEIDGTHNVFKKRLISGTKFKILPHEKRGKWWTLRGLSPGTQKVFTLTEGERLHHGLALNDVERCVTTLKHLPSKEEYLTEEVFNKYYRDNNAKCWLIKSHRPEVSASLSRYLNSVSVELRSTATCALREPWYGYQQFPISQIIVASGFTNFGPKVLHNNIKAHHVGSVYGIFGPDDETATVSSALRQFDFEKRVVAHSGKLKKIEVRQMNSVLNLISHGN